MRERKDKHIRVNAELVVIQLYFIPTHASKTKNKQTKTLLHFKQLIIWLTEAQLLAKPRPLWVPFHTNGFSIERFELTRHLLSTMGSDQFFAQTPEKVFTHACEQHPKWNRSAAWPADPPLHSKAFLLSHLNICSLSQSARGIASELKDRWLFGFSRQGSESIQSINSDLCLY